MNRRAIVIGGLLLASVAAGTVTDGSSRQTPRRSIGGYEVLAGDFHVHSFPFSWGTLSPWDTVLEARRQRLDVVAMTPHNHVWVAKLGRWFSRVTGGPTVLVGEEIVSVPYHLIAVGITDAISERQPAASAIAEVHRQGGVAIAAHPYEPYWPAYDAEALRTLDGAEVVRPEAQGNEKLAAELRAFFGRASMTAIGSSDYHGESRLGYSRTYVFARDRTEREILNALLEGRTVVYDRDRAYGDPALIDLAAKDGTLDRGVPDLPSPGPVKWFSRLTAVLGLAAVLLFNKW